MKFVLVSLSVYMVVLKRMLSDGSAAATAKALGPKLFPEKFLLLEVGDT